VSPWYQALAYALVGQLRKELDPEPRDIGALLEALGGVHTVARHRRQQRELAGGVWPHPVPQALRSGVGPAQFQALLHQAVAAVVAADRPATRPVTSARPPSADEQRLLRDVPPHHGQ
jgi:hypothetical protein